MSEIRIKVISELYDARKVRPEASCNALLTCCDGVWQVVSYSRKYDAFNAYDDCGNEHAFSVDYWCELPEFRAGRRKTNGHHQA